MNNLPGTKVFRSRRALSVHLECKWPYLKSVAERAGSYYAKFDDIQGGKVRHIDSPRPPLKAIQRKIARFLCSSTSLPASMLGGVKGGSPKKNALVHLGQKLVFKLDIRDCFPSIGKARVFKVFREQLNFSEELASLLTKLTTFQNRLPQGAPTSSTIANLALKGLHGEIQAVCAAKNVRCTFFVDDITLSGDQVRDVIAPVVALVKSHGFAMRPRKVKLLARHRATQSVTGIVVNGRKLSIGRERKTNIYSRILGASSSKLMSLSAFRVVRSLIAYAKDVSEDQGRHLESLALKKLPSVVVQNKRPVCERHHRPCSGTHKHTHKFKKKSKSA